MKEAAANDDFERAIRLKQQLNAMSEIETVRDAMKQAAADDDFELAARLKEEVKALEEGLQRLRKAESACPDPSDKEKDGEAEPNRRAEALWRGMYSIRVKPNQVKKYEAECLHELRRR